MPGPPRRVGYLRSEMTLVSHFHQTGLVSMLHIFRSQMERVLTYLVLLRAIPSHRKVQSLARIESQDDSEAIWHHPDASVRILHHHPGCPYHNGVLIE